MPYPQFRQNMVRRFGLVFFSLALLAACGEEQQDTTQADTSQTPRVIATIKPLHSLVASVMGDVSAPDLLIGNGTSPHAYALKPSDAQMLSQADLVFWAGPQLELFLERPLANLSTAETVALDQSEGLQHLPARHAGIWHDDPEDHHPHAEEERFTTDPHIWLSPANAVAMSHNIEASLTRRYPEHAAAFARNGQALRAQLAQLQQDLEQQLEPHRDAPYLVFHDAYQYFERDFELGGRGAVTLSPEHRPGARRLSDLQSFLVQSGPSCLFAEPQFDSSLMDRLAETDGTRLARLDPTGAQIVPGPAHYDTLLRTMSQDMVDCFESLD